MSRGHRTQGRSFREELIQAVLFTVMCSEPAVCTQQVVNTCRMKRGAKRKGRKEEEKEF
jgi:hypothetical protein